MSASQMTYAEFEPARELEPYVASFWSFAVDREAGPVEHWVPPDGCVSLAFRRGSSTAVVVGPWTVPLTPAVVAGDAFFGVRFWPGTAAALLPIEPMNLKDRVVSALEIPGLAWSAALAAEIWKRPDGKLDASVAARALAVLLPRARPLDVSIVAAARRIMATGGEISIAQLAVDAAFSPRQFRRRFTAAVGVSPKELARIWRLRRCALAALDPASPEAARWADLAAAHGFADQAHLVREFRHLLGLPPTAFARQFARIAHRDLQPT
ncbi:MAG: AraC family transcriptional regulator [Thermoanaerobaculia bacterium]